MGTYVEKVYNLSIFRKAKKDFGGQLFNSATVPISIIYYQKETPQSMSDTIEYCAPKTYVKSNIIDGLVIDSTDIKFLPRYECQKSDTKIWKIAMWGSQQDFAFLKSLIRKNGTLASDKRLITGRGLNADRENPDFMPQKILPTDKIDRYYTSDNVLLDNNKYYRNNNDSLFIPPYIIVKQGQHNKKIASSLIDYNAYCTTGAFILNGQDVPLQQKKALVAYFNSDLVTYILFLTSSSWGIEREQIFLNELLEMPSILLANTLNNNFIAEKFDNIVKQLLVGLPNQQIISECETLIQEELFKILNIGTKEQILIQDTINFNLDLFEQGENSIGFRRTLKNENELYANMLCEELNDFLLHSSIKVSATIYDVQLNDPLNLVKLSFGRVKKDIVFSDVSDLRVQLKKLNKYAVQEKSKNIYVQKQYRYFDNDTVYLMKPNQKRFWTRSQAMENAQSLIIEITNMGGSK